jgi:hypothetical protein
MEIYPPNFPLPLLTPYTWEVDMGLLRTPMDGGMARQRRLFDVMPHTIQVSFVVPQAQLTAWQNWVHLHAYEYFQVELLTHLTPPNKCGSSHLARFTTNLIFGTLTKGHLTCKVAMELSPAQISNYNPPASDDWVIAGIPDVPSNSNTYIAGNPDVPSPGEVSGGTPDTPS